MRQTLSPAIFLAAAVLLTSAPTAVAQSEAPPPNVKVVPSPSPNPGSWWLLETPSGSLKIELLSVDASKFVARVGERQVPYTREWNMLVGVGRTGAPVDYNPHLRSLSFPLWEGKRWGGVVWWTAGPESGSFSVNAQAKKWERIGVLAGTFEALRVETTTSGAQLNFWLKCWYVPEVQRFIKCDSNNARLQFELSQYGLVGSTASQ